MLGTWSCDKARDRGMLGTWSCDKARNRGMLGTWLCDGARARGRLGTNLKLKTPLCARSLCGVLYPT